MRSEPAPALPLCERSSSGSMPWSMALRRMCVKLDQNEAPARAFETDVVRRDVHLQVGFAHALREALRLLLDEFEAALRGLELPRLLHARDLAGLLAAEQRTQPRLVDG